MGYNNTDTNMAAPFEDSSSDNLTSTLESTICDSDGEEGYEPVPVGAMDVVVSQLRAILDNSLLDGERITFYSCLPSNYTPENQQLAEFVSRWNNIRADEDDDECPQLTLQKNDDEDYTFGISEVDADAEAELWISDPTEALRVMYHTGLIYDYGGDVIYPLGASLSSIYL